jgi:hypothetical protein
MGSDSSTDQSVGAIRVGRKDIRNMRDGFIENCKMNLARKGFTFKVANIQFEVANS